MKQFYSSLLLARCNVALQRINIYWISWSTLALSRVPRYLLGLLISFSYVHGQDIQEFQLRQRFIHLSDSSETRISLTIEEIRLVLDLDHQLKPNLISGTNRFVRMGGLNLGTEFRQFANPLGFPMGQTNVPRIPLRPSVTPAPLKELGVAVTLVDLFPSPHSLAISIGVIPLDLNTEVFVYGEGSSKVLPLNLNLRALVWGWQSWLPGAELERSLQGVRIGLEQNLANLSWYLWFSIGSSIQANGIWYGTGMGWRIGQLPRSIPTEGSLRYLAHLWIQGASQGQHGITTREREHDHRQVTFYQAIDLESQDGRLEPRVTLRLDSTSKSMDFEWLAQLLLIQTYEPLEFRVQLGTRGRTENLYLLTYRDWWFTWIRLNFEPSIAIPFGTFLVKASLEARFQVTPGYQSLENQLIRGDLPQIGDQVAIYGLELKNQNSKTGWSLHGKVEVQGGFDQIRGIKPRFGFVGTVALPRNDQSKTQESLTFEVSYRLNYFMEPLWFRGLNPGFFLSSPGSSLGILEVQWTLTSKNLKS
jgi:hypothetical protein